MASPHGHESSPHSPPKPGHGVGDGHGHGHGPPHPHSPPKPSDGGSVPAVDPVSVELSEDFREVVGLTSDQAKKIILQKWPGKVVDIIVAGEIRPEKSNAPNTVCLWLDPSGNVQIVEIPELDETATSGGGKSLLAEEPKVTAA